MILSDEDLAYDFLEHHGVKGMHWGVRSKLRVNKPTGQKFKTRSKKQKAAVVGAAFAGYLVGGSVGAKTHSPLLSIAGSAVGAVAGARFAKNTLNEHGRRKLSEIS